jgi:hypothetical protein
MSEAVWIGFVLSTTLAFGFFFFKTRRFDLLTVAYIGALFYFSPLFWGRVLQSSPDLASTIPPAVYLIATAYVLALVLAAIFSDDSSQTLVPKTAGPLAGRYLILAGLGLVGAVVVTKGAIFNADKVKALEQVGYFYVLFQIAASLACISAVIERRWWILASGMFFLMIDLLVGFRVFVVLTALSVALVMLMRDGRVRLASKTPTYGVAAVVLIIAMLLVHTVRFVIYDQVALMENTPRILAPQSMRGDTLQQSAKISGDVAESASKKASTSKKASDSEKASHSGEASDSAKVSDAERAFDSKKVSDDVAGAVSKWIRIPFDLLQRSEPAIIQATLAGIVQRNVSCEPWNIFKSLYLLVPPGLTRLVPNPFPLTFYEEYQPILYPHITYGTAGNIWAEMLCRFGYAGVLIFGALLILTLIGSHWLLRRASSATAAPIALGGIVIAFYIARNDLHTTLVMLRQIAIVFGVALVLSGIAARIRGLKPWI